MQGLCCPEPTRFSLLPFLVSDFGESQPLRASIAPPMMWGKNPCSTETKGCLYSAQHWEGLNGVTATRPRQGCGSGYLAREAGRARRDISPPPHQRAMSRAAAPPHPGSGAPSCLSLFPPRGNAGWRQRRWVCVSGSGGAPARGPRAPREAAVGAFPPRGVADLAALVGTGRGGGARRAAAAGAVPG